jgi:ABC-type uncharacterized transport system permease subunit
MSAPRSPSSWQLVRTEMARQHRLLQRHPLEAAVSTAAFIVMFAIVAEIGKLPSGPLAPFGGPLRAVGPIYVLWLASTATVVSGAVHLGEDAASGVLESLFLARSPIVRILAARTAARIGVGLLAGALLLLAFCLSLRWTPSSDVVLAAGVALVACCATGLGLGQAFSGVALLTRRIVSLGMVANFLCLLAFLARQEAPADDGLHPLPLWLPFVAAATLVRRAVELGRFDPVLAGQALFGSLAYLPAGHVLLARGVRACRRVGSTHLH